MMTTPISGRKWTMIAATLALMAYGPGTAAAQQTDGATKAAPSDAGHAMDHGGMGHGGMDHGGMDHGRMGGGGMGGMDHGSMGQGEMGHGGMGHGGMMGGGMGGGGHGGMDHGSMDKGGMSMGKSESGGMDHGAKGHGGGMMMGHMMCRTAEHVEGRLAYLKAELKLTDAQAPQWNAFADAVRDSGQKVAKFCATMKEEREKDAKEAEAGKAKPHGVLQQLDMMERHMSVHLESVRAVKSAAEPLFAFLTDEQKKTAEEIMTGMMGFGMKM
jgi:hypothetical protein